MTQASLSMGFLGLPESKKRSKIPTGLVTFEKLGVRIHYIWGKWPTDLNSVVDKQQQQQQKTNNIGQSEWLVEYKLLVVTGVT